MIQVLYKTYSSNKALWFILPTKLQNILNELFLKDVPGCEKPLPALQQASDSEIKQLHRLFSYYSQLGEKFENPQKKSLSNRCKKLGLTLPPQLAAFEAEQSSKNLERKVLFGAAVIATLAAWSFYTLIMKGLEDMEENPPPLF